MQIKFFLIASGRVDCNRCVASDLKSIFEINILRWDWSPLIFADPALTFWECYAAGQLSALATPAGYAVSPSRGTDPGRGCRTARDMAQRADRHQCPRRCLGHGGERTPDPAYSFP